MSAQGPSYLVLLGAPGSGKGTQATRLAGHLGFLHVSSGDIFRSNLQDGTPLGQAARQYLDRGELVPDDVTIGMVRERLARPDAAPGAVLDGFPRTTKQAQALESIIAEQGGVLEAVLYIEVQEAGLIKRLTGRRMCRAQGHIYHQEFNPPKKAGVCDIDGSELYQRADDSLQTVTHRIRVYLEQTAPLIDYYRKRGQLVTIEGEHPIDEITRQMLAALPHRGQA
jgi:adenylate kinase